MNAVERFYGEAKKHFAWDEDKPSKLPSPSDLPEGGFDPREVEREGDDLRPVPETLEEWRARARPQLDDDARERFEGGIRYHGLEVLAFYKSFRDKDLPPYRGCWGVFYLDHGLQWLKDLIEADDPQRAPASAIAHEFLWVHEKLHFKFDLYSLACEAVSGRSLYKPLKRVFQRHSIHLTEEALANRDAWDWARRPAVGLKDFAYSFMKLQPGAYARFDENKRELQAELATHLLDQKWACPPVRRDQSCWVANVPRELGRRKLCPEWLVTPKGLSGWINPALGFPPVKKIHELPKFLLALNAVKVLKKLWDETKRKLFAAPQLHGLNFKLWRKDDELPIWSVRVSDNYRAHLSHNLKRPGEWLAIAIGGHAAMGHG